MCEREREFWMLKSKIIFECKLSFHPVFNLPSMLNMSVLAAYAHVTVLGFPERLVLGCMFVDVKKENIRSKVEYQVSETRLKEPHKRFKRMPILIRHPLP